MSRRVGLVCIDVDGTLVGSNGAVHPRVWAAAQKARAAGLPLALCSGRPAMGHAREYAERLAPDGWHVFQNGSSILNLARRASRSIALPAATVAALRSRAAHNGRVLELYTDFAYAVESQDDRARRHAALLGVPFSPRSFDALQGDIVRAEWLTPLGELDAVLAEPHEGYEVAPSTSPVMADTAFFNLTPPGVDKASGVRMLAEAYAVSLDSVMYVGDGLNDVLPMRTVGFPVAVGNAAKEVKALARHLVASADEGGVADAIDRALSADSG